MLGRAGAWATAIQSAVATAEGGKYVRTTRFVSIGAGTSGTATLPLNSQVVLDDFGGTVDAVVLQISGGKPVALPALTASGVVVATTFDASGNWAFSGAPVSYPVALVYRVQTQLAAFDSTSTDIWGDSETIGVAPIASGGTGQSTFSLGDFLYASGANILSKLTGNSTATKKFLSMTSSVPAWAQPDFTDLTGSATLAQLPSALPIGAVGITIDGGGSALTTGLKGFITVPYACTIQSATLLADQSGSVVVNVYKKAYASFPPAVGDKITASAPPTITTAQKAQDTTLTGWTTAIVAGDVLAFNVDSCTTITRATLILKVTK